MDASREVAHLVKKYLSVNISHGGCFPHHSNPKWIWNLYTSMVSIRYILN